MRKLVILTQIPQNLPFSLAEQGGFVYTPTQAIPFSNAKSLLGQEHPFALYDMRAPQSVNLNIEALAIVAGTIQEDGALYLLCPLWHSLEQQIDFDSLRWNANHAIACPNFYTYFKQLVARFQFDVLEQAISLPTSGQISPKICKSVFSLTAEQQAILMQIPSYSADIHLITAPRGRGKSTLAGKLAQTLQQQMPVLITARNRTSLPSFWRSAEMAEIPFFAPDHLISLIEQQQIVAEQCLFIDEAASLPLPMLYQLCAYFTKVILTTTTHNYEGTGRGFSLKLLSQLALPYQHWQLNQPLRWAENDPLEQFIDELLLLSKQPQIHTSKGEFYHLLANAHYKTTPTDLRRLFDADEQILHSYREGQQLKAGIWAVYEGGLDAELTQAIWRGERRPQGNLVAQYLNFQGNLPQACLLRSVRVSRIAVAPEKQNQGIGKQLIAEFLQKTTDFRPLVDFVSVSFGLTESLLHFWQACGFKLVQITPSKEASSGYHSAMMLYPLTEQGNLFAAEAIEAFEQDLALHPFFSDLQKILRIQPLARFALNQQDINNLQGFAFAKRSYSACFVSLKRVWNNLSTTLTKTEVQQLREKCALMLQKIN